MKQVASARQFSLHFKHGSSNAELALGAAQGRARACTPSHLQGLTMCTASQMPRAPAPAPARSPPHSSGCWCRRAQRQAAPLQGCCAGPSSAGAPCWQSALRRAAWQRLPHPGCAAAAWQAAPQGICLPATNPASHTDLVRSRTCGDAAVWAFTLLCAHSMACRQCHLTSQLYEHTGMPSCTSAHAGSLTCFVKHANRLITPSMPTASKCAADLRWGQARANGLCNAGPCSAGGCRGCLW